MATSRIYLTSTQSSSTSRSQWHQIHTFSQEGRFTVNIKLAANEQGSERLKTKNSSHRCKLTPLTQTYSQKVFHVILCRLWYLQRPMDTEWQSSPCHLCAWSHVTLCPSLQHLSSRRLTVHKASFSWDVSGFWAIDVTGHASNPGPTHKLLSSQKECAKNYLSDSWQERKGNWFLCHICW